MRALSVILGLCLVPLAASAQSGPNLGIETLTVGPTGVAGSPLAVQFDVLVREVRAAFTWSAYLSTTGARAGARSLGVQGTATPTADGRLRVSGNVALPADVGGSYFLVVEVDPPGAAPDANRYDDAVVSDARVRIAARAADAGVRTVTPQTTRARVGDPVLVQVEVENTGTAATDVVVEAVVDRDGTPSTSDPVLGRTTVSLAAGARQVVVLNGTAPAGLTPGAHLVAAIADPDGSVSEVDEANNVVIAATPLTVFEDQLGLLTTSIPDGSVFQRYFARLESRGGDGVYQYTITRGRLPDGLTLGRASGEITGAPLSSGLFEVTIEVRSDVVVAEREYTLTVAQSGVELAVVTPELPVGTLGLPYGAELAAAGGEPPYSWTLLSGVVAVGLDIGTDGRISGVPTEEGTYTFTVEVRDALGGRVRTTLSLQIDPANVLITSLEPPSVPVGELIEITLAVKGGAAPYEWTALSTPPPGLTLREDGVFTGVPAEVGRFATRVRVTDGTEAQHTDTALVIVEVTDAGEFELVIPEVPRLRLRETLELTLQVEGGKPPYTWRVDPRDQIPAGFTLLPAELGEGEALLSGASIRPLDQAFLVEVTDKTGRMRSGIVAIHVDPSESVASSGCACVVPASAGPGALLALLGVVVVVGSRRRR